MKEKDDILKVYEKFASQIDLEKAMRDYIVRGEAFIEISELRICNEGRCTVKCEHKDVHSLGDCMSNPSCADGRCRSLTSDECEEYRIKNKGW